MEGSYSLSQSAIDRIERIVQAQPYYFGQVSLTSSYIPITIIFVSLAIAVAIWIYMRSSWRWLAVCYFLLSAFTTSSFMGCAGGAGGANNSQLVNNSDPSPRLTNTLTYVTPVNGEISVTMTESNIQILQTHAASFSVGALAIYGPAGESRPPQECLMDLRLSKPVEPTSYRIEETQLKFRPLEPGCYVFRTNGKNYVVISYSRAVQALSVGRDILKENPTIDTNSLSNQIELAIGSSVHLRAISTRVLEVQIPSEETTALLSKPSETDLAWQGLDDSFSAITQRPIPPPDSPTEFQASEAAIRTWNRALVADAVAPGLIDEITLPSFPTSPTNFAQSMDDSKIEFWNGLSADQIRSLKIVGWAVNELGGPEHLENSGVDPANGPHLTRNPTDLLGPLLGRSLKSGSQKLHSDIYFLNTSNLSDPFYQKVATETFKPTLERSPFPQGDIVDHILKFYEVGTALGVQSIAYIQGTRSTETYRRSISNSARPTPVPREWIKFATGANVTEASTTNQYLSGLYFENGEQAIEFRRQLKEKLLAVFGGGQSSWLVKMQTYLDRLNRGCNVDHTRPQYDEAVQAFTPSGNPMSPFLQAGRCRNGGAINSVEPWFPADHGFSWMEDVDEFLRLEPVGQNGFLAHFLTQSTLTTSGGNLETYPFAWFVILTLAERTFVNSINGVAYHLFDPAGSHGLSLVLPSSDVRAQSGMDVRFGNGGEGFPQYFEKLRKKYIDLRFHADPSAVVFKKHANIDRSVLNTSYSSTNFASMLKASLTIPNIQPGQKLTLGFRETPEHPGGKWGFEIWNRNVITDCTAVDFAQNNSEYYGYLGLLQLNHFAESDHMRSERHGASWNDVMDDSQLNANFIVPPVTQEDYQRPRQIPPLTMGLRCWYPELKPGCRAQIDYSGAVGIRTATYDSHSLPTDACGGTQTNSQVREIPAFPKPEPDYETTAIIRQREQVRYDRVYVNYSSCETPADNASGVPALFKNRYGRPGVPVTPERVAWVRRNEGHAACDLQGCQQGYDDAITNSEEDLIAICGPNPTTQASCTAPEYGWPRSCGGPGGGLQANCCSMCEAGGWTPCNAWQDCIRENSKAASALSRDFISESGFSNTGKYAVEVWGVPDLENGTAASFSCSNTCARAKGNQFIPLSEDWEAYLSESIELPTPNSQIQFSDPQFIWSIRRVELQDRARATGVDVNTSTEFRRVFDYLSNLVAYYRTRGGFPPNYADRAISEPRRILLFNTHLLVEPPAEFALNANSEFYSDLPTTGAWTNTWQSFFRSNGLHNFVIARTDAMGHPRIEVNNPDVQYHNYDDYYQGTAARPPMAASLQDWAARSFNYYQYQQKGIPQRLVDAPSLEYRFDVNINQDWVKIGLPSDIARLDERLRPVELNQWWKDENTGLGPWHKASDDEFVERFQAGGSNSKSIRAVVQWRSDPRDPAQNPQLSSMIRREPGSWRAYEPFELSRLSLAPSRSGGTSPPEYLKNVYSPSMTFAILPKPVVELNLNPMVGRKALEEGLANSDSRYLPYQLTIERETQYHESNFFLAQFGGCTEAMKDDPTSECYFSWLCRRSQAQVDNPNCMSNSTTCGGESTLCYTGNDLPEGVEVCLAPPEDRWSPANCDACACQPPQGGCANPQVWDANWCTCRCPPGTAQDPVTGNCRIINP